MDKATLDTIYELAKTLPPTHQETTRKMMGSELIEMGFDYWKGHEVDAGKSYCIPVRVSTNPVRVLVRIAKTKGMDAVMDVVHRLRNGQTNAANA